MKQKEEDAQFNGSREKINGTHIELVGDSISEVNASDGEREALFREQDVSIGTGEKHCNSVSNLDITLESRLTSSPFGSSVNVAEGTASLKSEEDADEDLSTKDLLCFAWQVAQGMVSNEGGEGKNQVQFEGSSSPKV